MNAVDATHDPGLHSWVAAANLADCDFPIQNLPFAVFRRSGSGEGFRCGVAIGDQVLDLAAVHAAGTFAGNAAAAVAACAGPRLNDLMAQGPAAWAALRAALSQSLRSGSTRIDVLTRALVPLAAVEFALPARIGDYTDFYTSIHHATNVGRLFRPDNPLLANYKWVPIAYHGRASSIRVSGEDVRRPNGQIFPSGAQRPRLGASRRLDYELELGVFIGGANTLGRAVALDEAEKRIFGLCLLNDWSARDLQAWEYQPLGPFLSKNFATTISPWIVTLAALAPFRTAWSRPAADPQPLPYLDNRWLREGGGVCIELEALLESQAMRERGLAPQRVSRANYRDAYWTLAQMIAHHTVNGCNLEPGDLLGTGTQSGPAAGESGSLLELSAGGTRPLSLLSGESRTFLEDGDRVTFRAHCERSGCARIGFGAVSSVVLPAFV